MLAFQLRAAIEAAPRERLSDLSKTLWQGFSAGAVTEAEAEEISLLIEARRSVSTSRHNASTASSFQRGGGAAIPARKPQRPPVRSVAVERRRRWAAAGRMPPRIAAHFTLGEQAALAVVAVEVVKRGQCTLALGHIAALAGVSITTTKRAIRQAKALGFIGVKERRLSRFRNQTNVVTVTDRGWLGWLELARGGGGQNRPGTNTRELYKEIGTASRTAAEGC